MLFFCAHSPGLWPGVGVGELDRQLILAGMGFCFIVPTPGGSPGAKTESWLSQRL